MILLALKAFGWLLLLSLVLSYLVHWFYIGAMKIGGDLIIPTKDLLLALLLAPALNWFFTLMNCRRLYRVSMNPFYKTKTAQDIHHLIYLCPDDKNELREKVLAINITLKQYEDLVRDYDYLVEGWPIVSEISKILKERERIEMVCTKDRPFPGTRKENEHWVHVDANWIDEDSGRLLKCPNCGIIIDLGPDI